MGDPTATDIIYIEVSKLLTSRLTPKQWLDSMSTRCGITVAPADDFRIYKFGNKTYAPVAAIPGCIPASEAEEQIPEPEFIETKLRDGDYEILEFPQEVLDELYDQPVEGSASWCTLY